MTLIAFHGKIGAGKNESCSQTKILLPNKNFQEKAFAAPIKELVATLVDSEISDQYEEQKKETIVKIREVGRVEVMLDVQEAAHHLRDMGHGPLERNYTILLDILSKIEDSGKISGYVTTTYGKLQQQIGTRLRTSIGEDIWVDAALFDWDDSKNWIFTDLRFPNEKRAIMERGGTCIKLVGDPKGVNKRSKRDHSHISETALDSDAPETWALVIDNSEDDIERLSGKLRDFYSEKGLLHQ